MGLEVKIVQFRIYTLYQESYIVILPTADLMNSKDIIKDFILQDKNL